MKGMPQDRFCKSIIITIVITVCFGLNFKVQAQDSSYVDFFPFKAGDFWVNEVSELDSYFSDERITVLEDSVNSIGEKVYLVSSTLQDAKYYFKVGLNGSIYSDSWYTPNEWVKIYEPNKSLGETWVLKKDSIGPNDIKYEIAEILDEYKIVVFGDSTIVKEIIYARTENDTSGAENGWGLMFAQWSDKFGILSSTGLELSYYQPKLKGGSINGTIFGDTTVYEPPDPSSIQKDYFPYEVGDILVFKVTDSEGNDLSDSRIEFISDSLGTEGDKSFKFKTAGYNPPFSVFGVDSSENIYASKWIDNQFKSWKIFDSHFTPGKPWVITKKESNYTLGKVAAVHNLGLYPGPDFWEFATGPVVEVHYYNSADSTNTVSSSNQVIAQWDPILGLSLKYDRSTETTYEIKGAFINGVVYEDTSYIQVGIDEESIMSEVPKSLNLRNYPNPFNGSTNFIIDIESEDRLSLVVFDRIGRMVSEVFKNKYYGRGSHIISWDVRDLSTGLYFVRLSSQDGVTTHKITLLK